MVRLVILLACVLLASCSRSPSAPSAPGTPLAFANFDGFWQGQFRYTQCDGERHCRDSTLGRTASFILNLRQSGPSVRGLLVTARIVTEVNGSVTTSGELVMSGLTPAAGARDNIGTINVTRFVVHQAAAGLVGSFAYTQTAAPESLAADYGCCGQYAGDIVSASRTAAPAPAISGRWQGQYAVRDCSLAGLRACFPFRRADVERVELTLVQNGTDVTGEIYLAGPGVRLPLHGGVNGQTVTLEGSLTTPWGHRRVTTLSAGIDEFGRLRGTFTHFERFRIPPDDVTESTVQLELSQVVTYRPIM